MMKKKFLMKMIRLNQKIFMEKIKLKLKNI